MQKVELQLRVPVKAGKPSWIHRTMCKSGRGCADPLAVSDKEGSVDLQKLLHQLSCISKTGGGKRLSGNLKGIFQSVYPTSKSRQPETA